jgi:hypothetical protein
MLDTQESTDKTHYICQTYVANAKGILQVGKLHQYTTAEAAEERAEREARAPDCVGADAYMLVEDANSGEVSAPVFLARHGTVPDTEMM